MVPLLEVVVLKSLEDAGHDSRMCRFVGDDLHGQGKSLIRTAALSCLSPWTGSHSGRSSKRDIVDSH
jgi:hypothetical protein